MQKCYIITAYIEGALSQIISPDESDFIICADGGYKKAIFYNLKPNIVIGDFDSYQKKAPHDEDTTFLRYPAEKDESDTFLCVEYAIQQGFDEIIIAGGIGGRLDHTFSNLQILARFAEKVKKITMLDEKNFVTLLENGRLTIPKREGWCVSIFSLSDVSYGVTTEGLFYPLRDATLWNTYPLGLSNVFCEDIAWVEVKSGKLLVILSKD